MSFEDYISSTRLHFLQTSSRAAHCAGRTPGLLVAVAVMTTGDLAVAPADPLNLLITGGFVSLPLPLPSLRLALLESVMMSCAVFFLC
jgi:hypothetical protein